MVIDKPKFKKNPLKGSGWRKISQPEDLEKCIVTMLNKILMNSDPLSHAGRFASLVNSWVSTRRLRLDSEELKRIEERLDALEQQTVNKR
jgi:uncharacterized protein Yka (UPF0111/DUF47 family)